MTTFQCGTCGDLFDGLVCGRCGTPHIVDHQGPGQLWVLPVDDRQVYEVTWDGTTAYYVALRRKDVTLHVMRSLQDAGLWKPGRSLKGLRARWLRAADVPPGVDLRVLV